MINEEKNKSPIISVVLGSLERLPFLRLTIATIREELKDIPHEIIVVDGGSSDGSINWLVKQKDVILILQHNRGSWLGIPLNRRSWGYFMNLGFRAAQGKYICMLSDDCLVVPSAIKNGLKYFEGKLASGMNLGALAFYWRNWPDQDSYSIGRTWGDNLFVNHGLYLRSALEAIGYADEDNYLFYHADGDLCLRLLQNGMTTLPSPNSFIEHYCHAAEYIRYQNSSRQSKDWQAYCKKWGGVYDPPKVDWESVSYADPALTSDLFTSIGSVKLFLIRLRVTDVLKKYPAAMIFLSKFKIHLLKFYGKIRH